MVCVQSWLESYFENREAKVFTCTINYVVAENTIISLCLIASDGS